MSTHCSWPETVLYASSSTLPTVVYSFLFVCHTLRSALQQNCYTLASPARQPCLNKRNTVGPFSMKTLFLAALVTLLSFSSAQAWTLVESKKLCTTTTQAFEMFKREGHQPVITTRLQAVLVTVWLNTKRELIVTNTVSVPNQSESLTCILTLSDTPSYVDLDGLRELAQ